MKDQDLIELFKAMNKKIQDMQEQIDNFEKVISTIDEDIDWMSRELGGKHVR